MIVKVEMFTIECDRCHSEFDFGDYSAVTKESIEPYLSDSDWIEVEDVPMKHYCPNCIEWSDKEDNYVVKKNL